MLEDKDEKEGGMLEANDKEGGMLEDKEEKEGGMLVGWVVPTNYWRRGGKEEEEEEWEDGLPSYIPAVMGRCVSSSRQRQKTKDKEYNVLEWFPKNGHTRQLAISIVTLNEPG